MIAAWMKLIANKFKTSALTSVEQQEVAELMRRREAANNRLGPLFPGRDLRCPTPFQDDLPMSPREAVELAPVAGRSRTIITHAFRGLPFVTVVREFAIREQWASETAWRPGTGRDIYLDEAPTFLWPYTRQKA